MSTLSTLLTRLSQNVGDYLSEAVTTALTTSTNVVCTTLGNYTNQDDLYNRFWLYVTDKANATQYRKVSDYTNSTTTLVVRGAIFGDDGSNKATIELHKYDRTNKIRALNLAARKVFPNIFRIVRDITLSGNNILPNPSFEDWTSSSYPDYWTTLSNATASEVTTAGLVRGVSGSSSVIVTVSAANGYIEINSDTCPQLLDLMGQQVSAYVWANPQTANDASLVIYTKQADGTAQTLTSSTVNPAGEYTLIKLEDETLNDDLVEVRIRLKVTTNGQYVHFDNARLLGIEVSQYVLPLDFQNPLASVNKVSYQSYAVAFEPQDDLLAYAQFLPFFGWDVEDDSTTKYLVTPTLKSNWLLKLEGYAPLESNLSTATDVMTIEDPFIDLLIERASSELFSLEAGLPSSGDRDFLRSESLRYLQNYEYLRKNLKMSRVQPMTHFRSDIL